MYADRADNLHRAQRGDLSDLTVLGVWAHPDDEAYLTAGLMGRVTDAGGRVVCVHATQGELGTDDPEAWPPARLAAERRRELAASLATVGVTDQRFLGYGDGAMAEVDDRLGAARIATVIERVRPDVIVTFGPDGLTGHADHQAIHRWTTQAWLDTGVGDLTYYAMTSSFLDRYRALHQRTGFFFDGEPAGHDDAELALTVELTDWELDRKRAALAAHATQTEGWSAEVGEQLYRRWWGIETFRRPTADDLAPFGPSRPRHELRATADLALAA